MNQRTNEYNQPIGEEVANWENRKFPGDMCYVGKYTIVKRLSHTHIEDLYNAYKVSAPSNWTYLPEEYPKDCEEFEQTLLKKIANPETIFYVVLNKETTKPLGIFSLISIYKVCKSNLKNVPKST